MSRDLNRYLSRFIVAGTAATSMDFGVFFVLRALDVPLLLANTAAFATGFGTGFLINRHWTFKATRAHYAAQLLRYGITAAVGFAVNTLVLVMLNGTGAAEIVSKAVATAASAAVNFIASRRWVFRCP